MESVKFALMCKEITLFSADETGNSGDFTLKICLRRFMSADREVQIIG